MRGVRLLPMLAVAASPWLFACGSAHAGQGDAIADILRDDATGRRDVAQAQSQPQAQPQAQPAPAATPAS